MIAKPRSRRLLILIGLALIGCLYFAIELRFAYDFRRFSTGVREGEPTVPDDQAVIDRYKFDHVWGTVVNVLTQAPPSGTSPLTDVELYIPEDILYAWQALNSKPVNLPYTSAQMRTKGTVFQNVKVKVRGDYSYHWGVDTPSLRIKMPKGKTFQGVRTFNVINPRSMTGFERLIGASLARRLGLITETSKFVRVFVNGESWGPFQYVVQLNESWLRSKKLLPGDLYSGEVDPFSTQPGDIKGKNRDVWSTSTLWKKTSFDNSRARADFSRIEEAISILSDIWYKPTIENRQRFEQIFEVSELVKLMAIENWIGSRHTDRLHNWRIYHDPSTGKLRPVVWDLWGHGHGAKANDDDIFFPLAIPQLTVLRFPDLYLEKNQELYRLMQEDMKQGWSLNHIDKLVGLTEKDYQSAVMVHRSQWLKLDRWTEIGTALNHPRYEISNYIDRIRRYVLERYANLEQALNKVDTKILAVYKEEENFLKLQIGVKGESALELEKITLDAKEISVKPQTLFPGVKLEPYVIWHSAYKGHHAYRWSDVLLKVRLSSSVNSGEIVFRNKVTGRQFTRTFLIDNNSLLNNKNDQLYNSGAIAKYVDNTITIGPGNVTLDHSIFADKNQPVAITAGTTLSLGKMVSIFVNGPLRINGTKQKPVIIKRKDKEYPWGALVVQNGRVYMSHTNITGGSILVHNSITYTGMLSIYNSQAVVLDSVDISGNVIGDDLVNMKNVVNLHITNTNLHDGNQDLLDIDYSKGLIDSSAFSFSGNDLLDLMGSVMIVQNSQFEGGGDKAISIGEMSVAHIENNTLKSSPVGLAIKDASVVRMHNNTFRDIPVWLDLYSKNLHYGGGGVILTDDHIPNENISLQHNSMFLGADVIPESKDIEFDNRIKSGFRQLEELAAIK